MFDLKINGPCRHLIYLEELILVGDYPRYFAQLKRAPNLTLGPVVIQELEDMFTNNNHIPYILFDGKKLEFNDGVDLRPEIYPAKKYYATYYTSAEYCPKCILDSKNSNELHYRIKDFELVSEYEFLQQKVFKMLTLTL